MEVVYVLVAAAAGYLATLVHKRQEVMRSVALEVDKKLQVALMMALTDMVDRDTDELNDIHEVLIATEHLTAQLAPRARDSVHDQVHIATVCVGYFFGGSHMYGPVVLQHAVHAAREVLAPLLLPPAVRPRRPAAPKSFPDPATFVALMRDGESFVEGFDSALGWAGEHGVWTPGAYKTIPNEGVSDFES